MPQDETQLLVYAATRGLAVMGRERQWSSSPQNAFLAGNPRRLARSPRIVAMSYGRSSGRSRLRGSGGRLSSRRICPAVLGGDVVEQALQKLLDLNLCGVAKNSQIHRLPFQLIVPQGRGVVTCLLPRQ